MMYLLFEEVWVLYLFIFPQWGSLNFDQLWNNGMCGEDGILQKNVKEERHLKINK